MEKTNNKDFETTLYALYDKISGFYSNIFLATNDGVACRNVKMSFDAQPQMLQDLELYKLAEFKQVSGTLVPCDRPEFVCRCADLKEA